MSWPTPSRAPSPRPLADLLLALAALVQQLRAPDANPGTTAGSAMALARVLDLALRERADLIIEVGTVQLMVEGMETNPEVEPLRDLTAWLRQAGVGALTFQRGVVASELLEVLTGVRGAAEGSGLLPVSPHVSVRPLRPSGPISSDPWRALERLVLDEPGRSEAIRDPMELAVGLELHPSGPGFDARVLELLTQMATRAASDAEEAGLLERLLERVPAPALRRLLAPTGVLPAQAEFLRAAVPLLGAPTLLRLAQVLAAGRDAVLSTRALRVLARLARLDPSGPWARRTLAEEVLRLLDLIYPDTAAPGPRASLEPDRVLKLALESGIMEAGITEAMDRMIARHQVAPLVALLETVPREDPVALTLRARLFHPQTVRSLLQASPVDLDTLDRLVPAAGIEAAPAMLDALIESPERRLRLRLLDLLARYGEAVAPLALDRLEGMPWYVQRNLLALLSRLPELPRSFSPERLLAHSDPRVRHEAITLAIADPRLSDLGLNVAMDSGYEPSLRLALATLAHHCPPDFVPRLVSLVTDASLDPEFRAMAVSALAPVNDPLVLRLLRRVVIARGITGLGRLAPKSPPLLAALRGLAVHWASHPKAGPLLETARQSRDAEIRDAARSTGRRSLSLPRPVM